MSDFNQIVKIIQDDIKTITLDKITRAVVQFIAILGVMYIVPNRRIPFKEMALIAVTGAIVAILLDAFAAPIGSAYKQSIGFILGWNLVNNRPNY